MTIEEGKVIQTGNEYKSLSKLIYDICSSGYSIAFACKDRGNCFEIMVNDAPVKSSMKQVKKIKELISCAEIEDCKVDVIKETTEKLFVKFKEANNNARNK